MSDVLVGVVTGAVLLVIGIWGRRRASGLAPRSLSEYGRASRVQELRRGATTLIVVAVVVIVMVVVRLTGLL